MANQEHLDLLKKGKNAWNKWRKQQLTVKPDLTGADLRGASLRDIVLNDADLSHANLSGANLRDAQLEDAILTSAILTDAKLDGARLHYATLTEANLTGASLFLAKLYAANLTSANLTNTDLSGADLSATKFMNATLSGANLTFVNLHSANLTNADLTHASLQNAVLVNTNFTHANLNGCYVYGISAWNVKLEGATQDDLIITSPKESAITVDNLAVAQFIYLLLNNPKIREVIDTITSKVVLLLGRFTPERKAVLDTLREELRKQNYLPIVFDFEKPASRDLTETISTLAHMARFVIADITDAKSIPQELMAIVPNLPSVPVQPLILTSQHEYGMFEHFTRFPWVLPVYRYIDEASLLHSLKEQVIEPAEQKAKELEKR